jgi:hypothetical protein
MAAALPPMDLKTASMHTRIPYGTLCRWAFESCWIPERKVGRRLFYAWSDIAEAVSARRERDAA